MRPLSHLVQEQVRKMDSILTTWKQDGLTLENPATWNFPILTPKAQKPKDCPCADALCTPTRRPLVRLNSRVSGVTSPCLAAADGLFLSLKDGPRPRTAGLTTHSFGVGEEAFSRERIF